MITIYYTWKQVNSQEFTARILSEYYEIHQPVFEKTEHGKPYLANFQTRFNLSHSGTLLALAVSEQEVGIDVEAPKTRTCPHVNAKLSEREQGENFLKVWTAKEAYVKFLGASLFHKLNRLEYYDGTLYEDGIALPVSLSHLEIGNATVCVCAKEREEISIILID